MLYIMKSYTTSSANNLKSKHKMHKHPKITKKTITKTTLQLLDLKIPNQNQKTP